MPPQDPTEGHGGYPGDPGTPVTGETAFRLDRWQRAGATDEEVAALRDHHSTLAPNQRAFEASAIDSTSDNELTEVLETMRNAEAGPALTALILTQRPGGPAAAVAADDTEAKREASGEDEETREERDAREAAEAEAEAKAAVEREAEAKAAAEVEAKAQGAGQGGPAGQ